MTRAHASCMCLSQEPRWKVCVGPQFQAVTGDQESGIGWAHSTNWLLLPFLAWPSVESSEWVNQWSWLLSAAPSASFTYRAGSSPGQQIIYQYWWRERAGLRAKWLASVAGQLDNKGEHRCTCLPAPASPLPGSWPPQLTMTASGQTARWGSPLPRHRIWELKDRGKTVPQNWEIRNDHRQRTRGETGHHKTEEAIWQWGENCHCQFSLTPWAFLMGSRKSVSGSRKCLQGTGNSLVMAWWLGMREGCSWARGDLACF